jgi:DNA-3-methyladenine glycosylase I
VPSIHYINRCAWAPLEDAQYLAYHDREWGVPVHDERALFELLLLEQAQAGLSWATVLHKRSGYRNAFAGFDPDKVARFERRRIVGLRANPAIIRNRLKIEAAVANARVLLRLRERQDGFDAFLWRYVNGRPVQNAWTKQADVPPRTALSDQLARDMKKLGFKFVGSTICYSLMQAAGLVNDHIVDCFRHAELANGR